MAAKRKKSKVTLRLSIEAPDAENVCVAGTFNDWNENAKPLKRDRQGVWKTRLELPPGEHEYKFVIDGHWQPDPGNPHTCVNAFGTANSVFNGE